MDTISQHISLAFTNQYSPEVRTEKPNFFLKLSFSIEMVRGSQRKQNISGEILRAIFFVK
jgi:hypothetical protein